MRTVHTTALAVVLLSAGARVVARTPSLPLPPQNASIRQEIAATQTLQQRVDEHVTLHRLLEGPLPPLRPTRDMSRIDLAMRALAGRIQLARARAQQGDIIAADVARMLRWDHHANLIVDHAARIAGARSGALPEPRRLSRAA